MAVERKEMGKRISHRRKELHMKQATLAEKLNISNNHMSSIENGRENPSLDLLCEICKALRVSPNYLLFGTMNSYNIPENIIEKLQLCNHSDILLANNIIELLIERNENKQ